MYRIGQSFCFGTISVLANYLGGYKNISPWCMFGIVLLYIYRNYLRQLRKYSQQVAIAVSLRSEEQVIGDNVHQPPPWVHFPEIDTCEFVNKILYNIWPSLCFHTERFLKDEMEPRINEAISAYKKNPNFTFHTIRFGSVFPRISGFKVYKKYSRLLVDIILDIRFYYAGDAEIYFHLMSFGGGVQNLEISGWIRVVFRVKLYPRHHLGGVEIFFLQNPKFNYEVGGAIQFLKLPGVRGMLRRVIDEQVAFFMVMPNKITFNVNADIDSGYWKCPDPGALIRIHVIEARSLMDTGSQFYDPYVMATFGPQTSVASESSESSINPKWNFWADFMVDSSFFDEYIFVSVIDRDENITLGKVSVELDLVQEKKYIRSWVQLEETTTGMINLELFYYDLTYNVHDPPPLKQLYALVVFIDKASKIVNNRTKKMPNAVVYLDVGDGNTKATKSVLSENPVFEEAFLFFLNDKPDNSRLTLKISDENTKTDLGSASIPLRRVLETNFKELIDETFPLVGTARESSIFLSMRLRILKK